MFSKAHIHISKTHLYSHGAVGCHSPSCAWQSKTMGKKLSLKIFVIYFIFSTSGELSVVKPVQFPTDSYICELLYSCMENEL